MSVWTRSQLLKRILVIEKRIDGHLTEQGTNYALLGEVAVKRIGSKPNFVTEVHKRSLAGNVGACLLMPLPIKSKYKFNIFISNASNNA